MKTEWESECWLSTYLSDLFLGARFFLVYAAHLKISPRQTNLVSSHENKISCHATKNWLLHYNGKERETLPDGSWLWNHEWKNIASPYD